MGLRVSGGNLQHPLYAIQQSNGKSTLIEDVRSGFFTAIRRLCLQITGKLDYNLQNIAKLVAITLDQDFTFTTPGKVSPTYCVKIDNRDIKIMGLLAGVDAETWRKVTRVGQALLQITNDNWYQTNDQSWDSTHSVKRDNRELFARLKKDPNLRRDCELFIAICPSRLYRVMIRLALQGEHEYGGSNSTLFS